MYHQETIVLKDTIAVDEYNHFKLLSCATILCSSVAYKLIVNNTSVVGELIKAYIEQYIILYGERTISSNMHNLSHLLDDVRRFGNLNTLSTYPFENCLQMIKSKLEKSFATGQSKNERNIFCDGTKTVYY